MIFLWSELKVLLSSDWFDWQCEDLLSVIILLYNDNFSIPYLMLNSFHSRKIV